MSRKSKRDFWIEMSIREITTQAHFADFAFKNINTKAPNGNDLVFTSIHSFLSHCANVSKLLCGEDKGIQTTTIGKILGVSEKSLIHNRKFRNHLDHYDERLKEWIREVGTEANIGTYNIGPKVMLQNSNIVFVSHYDPSNKNFTFVNEDFDIGRMHREVMKIKKIADKWVSANT